MGTKKIVFVLLALFLICPVAHSQKNIEQLFKKFSNEKGVDHVNFGMLTMKLAGLFTNVKGISGIEVYRFDNCKQSVKKKLNKAIASLKDKDYETVVSVDKEKINTRILMKLKDDVIKELVILKSGDNPVMFTVKGNIKPADIEELISIFTSKDIQIL